VETNNIGVVVLNGKPRSRVVVNLKKFATYAKVLSSIVNVLLQQGGRQCDYVGALIYIRAKSIPTNVLPLFAMIREDDNADFCISRY
jgi:hypothetical protein